MKTTTLCYIEHDNKYLMLYRNKKENDENAGKWVGIGGKLEANESPEECLVREVKEETGIELTNYQYRGLITFVSDIYGTELMHLFTATVDDENVIADCDEGELKWIDKKDVPSLNVWEGDREFLKLLSEDSPFFSMKLSYIGDTLTEVKTVF